MNFETWWNLSGASVIHKEPKDAARDAWDCQQERIDELNECLEQALSDLKYWEEKAINLEYEKTLTGDSAV